MYCTKDSVVASIPPATLQIGVASGAGWIEKVNQEVVVMAIVLVSYLLSTSGRREAPGLQYVVSCIRFGTS